MSNSSTQPIHHCDWPAVQWSMWLSTRLGLLLGGTLLAIIRTDRSAFLADYRRLLAVLSTNDFISCLYVTYFPLVNTAYAGTSLFYVCDASTDTWMRTLPMTLRFALISMSMGNTHILIFLSCMPFFYRYMILIRDRRPPPWLINLIVLCCVAAGLAIGWFKMTFGYQQIMNNQFNVSSLAAVSGTLYPYIFIHYTADNTPVYNTMQWVLSGVILAVYLVTAFFYAAVMRLLGRKRKLASTATSAQLSLQRQLSIILTIQVIIPLIMTIIPYVTTYSVQNVDPVVTLATKMVFYWVPCANATLTLLVIRPYRQALWRFLGGRTAEESRVNVTMTVTAVTRS